MRDPLAERVASAWTVRAAIFEPPPAMMKSVGTWIRSVYAGHVLADVEEQLERGRDPTGLLEARIQEMRRAHESAELDIKKLKPGQQIRYKVWTSFKTETFFGVRRNPESWWDSQQAHIVHGVGGSQPKPHYEPLYETGKGVKKVQYEYGLKQAEEVIHHTREVLEYGIKRMEGFLRGHGFLRVESPSLDRSELVALVMLKRECLKYVESSKWYTAKATRKFPIDLTGWKYLRSGSPIIKRVNEQIEKKNEGIRKQVEVANKTFALATKAYDLAKKSPEGEADPEVWAILLDLNRKNWVEGGSLYRQVVWDQATTEHAIHTNKRPSEPLGWVNGKSVPIHTLEASIEPLLGPEDVVKALATENWDEITVLLDFKGHAKSVGTWSMYDRTLTVDVRGRSPHSVESFQAILGDILRTTRHELQHLGQDILTRVMGLKSEAGTPAQDIRVPSKPSDKRKEHALREEEFYTRLADEIDKFVAYAKKIPKESLRDTFTNWVAGDLGGRKQRLNLLASEFFSMLKKHEPLKWQKAVKEFLKGINTRGVLV